MLCYDILYIMFLFIIYYMFYYITLNRRRGRASRRRGRPRRPYPSGAGSQDSSKGGAVETGCSGLHYIVGCVNI